MPAHFSSAQLWGSTFHLLLNWKSNLSNILQALTTTSIITMTTSCPFAKFSLPGVGNSSPRGTDWCHSFAPAPANTPDSNNHLIMIFSLECNMINQLCLLGMVKKCDTNQALKDWSLTWPSKVSSRAVWVTRSGCHALIRFFYIF